MAQLIKPNQPPSVNFQTLEGPLSYPVGVTIPQPGGATVAVFGGMPTRLALAAQIGCALLDRSNPQPPDDWANASFRLADALIAANRGPTAQTDG